MKLQEQFEKVKQEKELILAGDISSRTGKQQNS